MQVLKKPWICDHVALYYFPQVILSFIQQLFEKDSPGSSLWAGLWEHNRNKPAGLSPLPAATFQWGLQKGHCHLYVRSATFPDHVLREAGPWGDRNSFPPPQLYLSIRPWAIMPTGSYTTLISLSSPESRFGCFSKDAPHPNRRRTFSSKRWQLTLPYWGLPIRYNFFWKMRNWDYLETCWTYSCFSSYTLLLSERQTSWGYVHCRAKDSVGWRKPGEKGLSRCQSQRKLGASYRVTLHPE